MNYKKIIPSQNIRFGILKILSFLPDRVMLGLQYYIKMGRKCNFNKPKTWTEKLQLYKIYYRNPILGICVDKYNVRQYVTNCGLKDILVDLYGIFLNAEDINLDKLPKSFVVKTTDGGGGNNIILVKDKFVLDRDAFTRQLNSWLNIKDINAGREWAYTQIAKSQIIVEKLLVNDTCPEAGIEDFKFLCFHGEPKYIVVDKDRYIKHKRNIYDVDWRKIDVSTDHEQFEEDYKKPENLSRMIEIARILSQDFPFVRVDLYNIHGKIYFGELTFYPWSGYVKFNPFEFDEKLGQLLDEETFKQY